MGYLGKWQTHGLFYYHGCKLSKFSTLSINRSVSSSVAPFDLVFFDVMRPFPFVTKGTLKRFPIVVNPLGFYFIAHELTLFASLLLLLIFFFHFMLMT